MSGYTKFKIEATHDDTSFRILVMNWLGIWRSGFIYTDYFAMSYNTKEDALAAVRGYKNRFTDASK